MTWKVQAWPRRNGSLGMAKELRGNRLTLVHLQEWPLKCSVCANTDIFLLWAVSSQERSRMPSLYWRDWCLMIHLLWSAFFFGLKSVEELIYVRWNRCVSSENSLISKKYCWPCFCSCGSCLFSPTICASVFEHELYRIVFMFVPYFCFLLFSFLHHAVAFLCCE